MSMIKRWRDWKRDRDSARIGRWINQGIKDNHAGVPPSRGPYNYGTRAYIWWICGWSIAYQNLDEPEAPQKLVYIVQHVQDSSIVKVCAKVEDAEDYAGRLNKNRDESNGYYVCNWEIS